MTRMILIFFILVLSGCQTVYKPSGLGGGYSEERLNQTTYLVHFRGNGYTSQSTVNKMLLRRAADLTKQNGYRYFAILNSGESVRTGKFSTPSTYGGYSQTYFNNDYSSASTYSTGTIYPGQIFMVHRYLSTLLIRMIPNPKNTDNLLDANMILTEN